MQFANGSHVDLDNPDLNKYLKEAGRMMATSFIYTGLFQHEYTEEELQPIEGGDNEEMEA